MSKITEFRKETFGPLRADLEAAVKSVAEKYGVQIKTGHISYTGTNCSVKLECAVIGEDGKVARKEADTFRMWAELIGMKKEDLNRVFKIGTKNYSLEGYMPRKTKFPFLALNLDDGKQYCLPETAVKKALGYVDTPKKMEPVEGEARA